MAQSIYQCEDEDPPSRLVKSVKRLCEIKWAVDVAYSSLKDYTGANGRRIKRVDYEIEMIPSGASNEFRVIYKGEKLGSHSVRTEFQ